MLLVILLVMAVYFTVGGILGYILGRVFGRGPLLVVCVLLGLATVAFLILPAIGVDMSAILGDDTQGNRILGYSALAPALVGAVLFGWLGLRRAAMLRGGQG